MQKAETLEAAFQMMDRFGASAELRAGDEMDRALELGDASGFDKWRLIGETIAALGRRNPTNNAEQGQPVKAVLPVRAGRNFVPG